MAFQRSQYSDYGSTSVIDLIDKGIDVAGGLAGKALDKGGHKKKKGAAPPAPAATGSSYTVPLIVGGVAVVGVVIYAATRPKKAA